MFKFALWLRTRELTTTTTTNTKPTFQKQRPVSWSSDGLNVWPSLCEATEVTAWLETPLHSSGALLSFFPIYFGAASSICNILWMETKPSAGRMMGLVFSLKTSAVSSAFALVLKVGACSCVYVALSSFFWVSHWHVREGGWEHVVPVCLESSTSTHSFGFPNAPLLCSMSVGFCFVKVIFVEKTESN